MPRKISEAAPPHQVMLPVLVYRFGFLICIILLFVVFSSVDKGFCSTSAEAAVSKSDALGCFEYWLNRYQSLIAGFLALFGAFLAFGAVRGQIAQTERHAEERRERESNAARAVLPQALDKLGSYSTKCVSELKALRRNAGRIYSLNSLRLPEFPHEVISVFKDAVEFSAPVEAEQFADLIAHAQVQRARFVSLHARGNSSNALGNIQEVDDAMKDAIDLHARSMRLFDYARRYMDRKLVTNDDLQRSAFVLDVDTETWRIHGHGGTRIERL